jgi:HK97 family phage major capsid protein
MDINALSQALDKYTADTTAKVSDALDQFRDLQDSVDRIEARMNRPGFGGGNRSGVSADLGEVYAAISGFTRSGDESGIRALSVSDDTAAGYLVSPQLSEVMSKRIFDQSPIRRLVRIVEIGDSGSFQEPIDTDDVGAEWVGEEEERICGGRA